MRIRWTQAAARDLTGICDYTNEQIGPEAARKLALRVYEVVGSLTQFPNIGRPGRKTGTREITLRGLPFLAIYRTRESTIEIVRILHGAQRWP